MPRQPAVAVLKGHHVMDVMVHIDSEDDVQAKPNAHFRNVTCCWRTLPTGWVKRCRRQHASYCIIWEEK